MSEAQVLEARGKKIFFIGKWLIPIALIVVGGASLFPMHEWSMEMANSHVESDRVIWYFMLTWFCLPIPAIIVSVILGIKKRIFVLAMFVVVCAWLMASSYALTSGKCEVCERIYQAEQMGGY